MAEVGRTRDLIPRQVENEFLREREYMRIKRK